MAADIHLNQTAAVEYPSAIVSKIRFDPTKRHLTSLVHDVGFTAGRPDIHEESIAARLASVTTSASQTPMLECADKIIREYGTAVKLEKALWPQLPTIADYVDLDTLYDMDEVQSAFYEATKRQGW